MRKGKIEKVKKNKRWGNEWTRGRKGERGAPAPRRADERTASLANQSVADDEQQTCDQPVEYFSKPRSTSGTGNLTVTQPTAL